MVIVVKNPPAKTGDIREAGSIPGLGGSLEEEMASHSSILARRIPGQRSLEGYIQSVGSRSQTQLSTHRDKTPSLEVKHLGNYFRLLIQVFTEAEVNPSTLCSA